MVSARRLVPLALLSLVVSLGARADAKHTFFFPNLNHTTHPCLHRARSGLVCVQRPVSQRARVVLARFHRDVLARQELGTVAGGRRADVGPNAAAIKRLILVADGNDPNYSVRMGQGTQPLEGGAQSDFQGALGNTQVLYPGAIVQGAPPLIDAGKLDPIGLQPSGGVVTVLGPQFTSGSSYRTVPVASAAMVNDAIHQIVGQPFASDQFGSVFCNASAVHSVEEAVFKIDASFNYASMARVTDALSSASDKTSNHVLLRCTQEYYSATYVPNPDANGLLMLSAFFDPRDSVDDLASVVGPGRPPLYVQQVTYGAEVFAMFDTTQSSQSLSNDLNGSFQAGVYGGSLDVSTDMRKDIDDSRATVFAVGGRASAVKQVLANTSAQGGLTAQLEAYLDASLDISASDGAGQEWAAPIAYNLSYLDNQQTVQNAEVFGPAQEVSAARVTKATIAFHQNGDGKDYDTVLDVYLKDRDGNIVGRWHRGNDGKNSDSFFPDDGDVGPFTFSWLSGPPLKEAMDGGRFKVAIEPVGHDTWNYTATLTLYYSDGTVFTGSGRHTVSQDYPQQDDLIFAGPGGTGFFH